MPTPKHAMYPKKCLMCNGRIRKGKCGTCGRDFNSGMNTREARKPEKKYPYFYSKQDLKNMKKANDEWFFRSIRKNPPKKTNPNKLTNP